MGTSYIKGGRLYENEYPKIHTVAETYDMKHDRGLQE
jgi:hypothetical protein